MKKFILFFCLALSACKSTPVAVLPQAEPTKTSPASNTQLEKAKEAVDLDRELLKECPSFSKLLGDNPTPNQILDQHANDVLVHTTCRLRHSALIKIVKDAFNIQE